MESLAAITVDCQPALLLSVDSIRSRLPASLGTWHFSNRIESLSISNQFPVLQPEDIALIQYTSGSTRDPRGVVITHSALQQQLENYRRRAGDNWARMAFAGWLPHHHDFGLIGFILSALYMGVPYTFMPPAAFLQKPVRWLKAISHWQATYSGGPNFAYDLCSTAVSSQDAFDLSCWQIASVGGEPVAATTMRTFAETFQSRGFRRESLLPAYGLAEAVLCVAAKRGLVTGLFDAGELSHDRAVLAKASSESAIELVSCGWPSPEQPVVIVDSQSNSPVPHGTIGEVWIAGSGLATGYWRNDAETVATFHARLNDGREFLRTGDLGFLHNGELYLTGRMKDVLIVRGRNHSPEDIEWTIQSTGDFRRIGTCAIFQVNATAAACQAPRLVTLLEIEPGRDRDFGELFATIRNAVARKHGLRLDAIELLRPRSLPRTSSGKISRHRCREAWQAGQFRSLASSSLQTQPDSDRLASAGVPLEEIELQLLQHVRSLLPGLSIGVNDNLFSLGADSLTAQRYLAQIRETFAIDLPASALFDAPDVASLARVIADYQSNMPASADPPVPVTVPDTGTTTVSTSGGDRTDVLDELRRLNQLMELQVRLLTENNRLLRQQIEALRGPTAAAVIASDESPFELTEAQREIRLLPELHPAATAAFHSMMVLEFSGAPSESAIRDVWQKLARGHDALRLQLNGEHQRVVADVDVDFHSVSLDIAQDVNTWLRQERQRPFQLDRAPLWRVSLLTPAAGPSLLVFCAHHLIVDGWSLHLLAREFSSLYRDSLQGLADTRPAAPQFRQYFQHAADRRQPALLESHRNHWRALVGSQLPDLDLLVDTAPTTPDFTATVQTCVVDDALRQSLSRIASDGHATLFHTLLAAWFTTLGRLTGQDRLIIGMQSSDRDIEQQQAIGCCNLLVPIVVDLPVDPTVEQFQRHVRDQVLQAVAHQDYTLSMLAQDLRTPLDTRRPFKLTATINMLRVTSTDECRPRFDLDAHSITHSPFGLTLDIRDTGASLRCDFIANRNLFDDTGLDRVVHWFQRTLETIAGGLQSRLFRAPLVSAAELETLRGWGDGGPGFSGDECLAHRFEQQAEKAPEAVAVRCADNQWTYKELSARSRHIAACLRQSGVEAGSRIGLLCRRSSASLAALLGILKAGCVYVPLDPAAPDSRLRQQVESAQIGRLLCSVELQSRADAICPKSSPPIVLTIEDCFARSLQPASACPAPRGTDAAYALYTSGSTGAPKAVLVSHRGLMNHLLAKVEILSLTANDRVAQTASVCFDISVWQFLAPLLVGATVHVLDDDITLQPGRLLEQIDKAGITIFQSVPTMIRRMVEAEAARPTRTCTLKQLRWMVSIGEILPPDLARKWISLFPRVPLLNAYGPAECSDTVSHHAILWPPNGVRRIPIGRPVAGARLYVLDRRQQIVPTGVPGELTIGGPCVGLGYLNDAAQTAAAFVPDTLSSRPGERLYRTGDLARFRHDGQLEILGRCDRQLKFHGVRIEPGEIEAALQNHPHVVQSIVTVKQMAAGDEVLTAYVVLRPGTSVTPGVLRALARNKLPQALVPTVVVFLNALPTSPSGKIDLAALPEPSRETRTDECVPPVTPIQRQLVQIWTDVIHHDRIGIHDDLFELGGRSLDAARIATQIGNVFQFRMPVSEIFRTPTVAGIASYLERRDTTRSGDPSLTCQPASAGASA